MTGEERLKYLLQKITGSKEFPFDESNWEKMKTMLPDNEASGEAEFKNSLNKILEAKTFPFDEGNWEKMKELLPERDKKRRFAFILFAGLLTLGGLGYLFFSQSVEVGNEQVAISNKQESSKSVVGNEQLATDNKQSAINKLSNLPTPKPLKHETEQQKTTSQKSEVGSEQLATDELSDFQNFETSQQETTKQETNISEQFAVENVQLATEEHSNVPNFETLQPETIKQDSTKQETEQQEITKQETKQPDTSFVTPVDTVKTASAEIQKYKKPVMYFEAGGDYLLGWKNAGKAEAKGFNPVIGFNYYNYLNENLALSLGAQYTSVNNLNDYSNTSKVTRYGFGEESAVTVITPVKLHYLVAPVKLHYFMNEKNSFGIGFNFAYLLTVDSKMETYNIHLGRKEDYQTGKTNGYTEGFNMFDTQAALFYHRRLYKNIGMSAELFYGLSDVKNDLFFKVLNKEHNRGVKLTLTYAILK